MPSLLRLICWVAILNVAAAEHAISEPQSTWTPPCTGTCPPETGGIWSIPMAPSDTGGPDASNFKHNEIAHAVVLPIEHGEVLFWSLPNQQSTVETAHTYIWSAAGSAVACELKTLPTAPPLDGNPSWVTLKGATAVHLADGDVFAVGPSHWWPDYHGAPPDNGSPFSYRFDVVTRSWSLVPGQMTARHWYPSGIVDEFGNVLAIGHDNHPGGTCTPASDSGIGPECDPGLDRYEQFTFSPSTATYSWNTTPKPNRVSKSVASTIFDCPIDVLRIHQFPRVHLLGATGQLFYANAIYFRPPSYNDEWAYAVWDREFPQCALSPRWTARIDSSSETHQEPRKANATAHYVWYGAQGEVHDSIYSIGGTNRDSCNNSPADVAFAQVDRIVDPDGVVAWNNQGNPPDLHLARKNLNGVILLDGSILAIGGLGAYDPGAGECPAIFTPELFEPQEAFGTSSTEWLGMNPHLKPRHEHSVAVLLPDGRVFSAGGKPGHAYYTYEIFEPPYHYKGRVPRVLSLPSTSWTPFPTADTLTINVRCFDGAKPKRAALLRLGSSTHNFDTGQRYVALLATIPSSARSDGTWDVDVTEPVDLRIAPIGVYWFTIVDDRGRPSEGRLITITK